MTLGRPVLERTRIAIAFAGFVLIGIGASAGGVLLPAQIADYGVDKTTIGVMFIAFSVGYVTSAVASGGLLHRFGTRVWLTVGAALMLVASVSLTLRPPFVGFVVLQLAYGFGGGAFESSLNTYLSTLDRSTSLLNSLHAFFGVGALLGPAIAATMLSWGLRWTAFFALLAVLLVPIVVAVLTLYPRGAPAAAEERPRLTEAVRRPAVWLLAAFLAVYVGLEVSLGNWGFSFLTEERGQDVLLAGWVMSGYWAGLTVGRFVLNRITDRIGLTEVGMITACLVGIGVGSVVVWAVPSAAVATVGLVLVGFFLGPLFPTAIAVVPRLTPAHLVATAIGILVGLSAAGGALAPFVAGAVAQRIGVWSLLPYAVVLTAMLVVIWWRIAHRLRPAAEPEPVVAVESTVD